MKRVRYEPQVKASILEAVRSARNSGKTWAEALETAKLAGYKGTAGGLVQLVGSSKRTKATAASKTIAPATTIAKMTRRKRKAKSAAAAPFVSSPTVKPPSGPLDISALVHAAVTDAVVTALEGLLARLKGHK